MTASSFAHDSSPLPELAPRPAESHKADFGRALLLGGSIGMNGAIALAGMAALRGGAGLVRLGVPRPSHGIVATFNASYMVTPLDADRHGSLSAAATQEIQKLIQPATAIGCGPGLTTGDGAIEVACMVYQCASQPSVFDADALNALARRPESFARPGGARILTPHPGEFQRLLGDRRKYSPVEREALAASFARQHGVVLVLKGHGTVVSDGERVYVNATGNPGMATGGTGDVLTGLLVALLCQGLEPYDAARLGVYLHGLAGDLAAAKFGQVSLIASDLIDFLPLAIRHYQGHTEVP
jgi:ADP-dependent NAD(P)H-hydrate dehydratase